MKNSRLKLPLIGPVVLMAMVLSAPSDLVAQRQPPAANGSFSGGVYPRSLAPGINRKTSALSVARKKLAAAKSDEDKAGAEQELRQATDVYFGEDMERREKELESIRQRVVRMESHLNKRVSAKSEIIELQLKAFVYEAKGLGLFSPRSLSTQRSPWISGAVANRPQQDGYVSGYSPYVTRGATRTGTGSAAKSRLDELRKKLTSAETQAERESVQSDLKQAMSAYFDEDMKRRQQELEDIRKRIDNMETHLARRISAKQDIVDLQVKMFTNEAEGLGFFEQTNSARAGQFPTQSRPVPSPAALPAR